MTTTARDYQPPDALLALHGDAELDEGLVDLGVNVRRDAPPLWLKQRLASVDLAAYPDQRHARAAVAARHGRDEREVLLTAGASEAFVLIARAATPRHAVVVHPQFTEPEIALRAAGHEVERVVLRPPFTLAAQDVPDDADLVVIGNPTNPTSVVHSGSTLRAIARPGRTLVIDEAFADAVAGEAQSLASARDLPGAVVVRSLTKTWGLAGLRVGYVLGPPDVIDKLAHAQPQWPVSAPALEACIACSEPSALAEAATWAIDVQRARLRLASLLSEIDGVIVNPHAASFVLVHVDHPDPRGALRAKGFAVRRGDTFPGLGRQWIRVAVRDDATSYALANALKEILCQTSTT